MCGRYRLARSQQEIEEHFDLPDSLDDSQKASWEPRYNIAPSQLLPVVRQAAEQPGRRLVLIRWGLVPSWVKDARTGSQPIINAMSESAADKPAFREAIRRRRCLLPADGFYEWRKTGTKQRQPYNFSMADGALFALGGLWERWRDPAQGSVIETCAILTTRPNALVAEVHNRMPVIVPSWGYDRWLDPSMIDPEEIHDLLQPFDAGLMKKNPVSTRVNSARYDGPECAEEPRQGELAF